MRTLLLTLTTCLLALPANAKYSGGSGTPADPYRIATAADLIALGRDPNDYRKHFKLTTDIDLSGFDDKDGRPAFNVIGDRYTWTNGIWTYVGGTPFSGVFDGNGDTISHLKALKANGDFRGLFGAVGQGGVVKNLRVLADVTISGTEGFVGALAGYNGGTVTQCSSEGVVTGMGRMTVGGLVGLNWGGTITDCHSTAAVCGGNGGTGGLLGQNSHWQSDRDRLPGRVSQCYSAGRVSGDLDVGGLVGNNTGDVVACLWDTQTSGQPTSAGGIGKTTAEMRVASTFLGSGWDFVGETKNGTKDIWWILEGQDYPRLAWERVVFDDFADGKAGPLWTTYEPQPERVRLREVHGRLEVEAAAQEESVDAFYASNGWRLKVSEPFALRVDFHFGKEGTGNGRMNLGLVPSLDPAGMRWAEFEAGCFDIGPIYLYEVRDGDWVEEQVTDRSSDSGTLYMSYNPDTDELYFSTAGYGKPNAWKTVRGLLKGRWAGGPVYVILSGGSAGMALTSGDAWFDNFTISTGVIVR